VHPAYFHVKTKLRNDSLEYLQVNIATTNYGDHFLNFEMPLSLQKRAAILKRSGFLHQIEL